ncbi:MAG: O-methyltransferase [Chitinophagaceae bacterium]
MDIIDPQIQAYAESYSSPEDALLKEIAEYTIQHHSAYHMLSGHLQGQLLEMVSRMIQPRRILEIGTFTGYSALCLAKGLVADGQLHTIELREADASIAKNFFNRSPLSDRIILHTGNALEIIPKLHIEMQDEPCHTGLDPVWDLVFIDADKVSYIEYFNLVLPLVRQNGFILADNVFFHGQVLDNETKNKSATAIRSFNEYVRERKDVDKMIMTVRDGLYLIRKI